MTNTLRHPYLLIGRPAPCPVVRHARQRVSLDARAAWLAALLTTAIYTPSAAQTLSATTYPFPPWARADPGDLTAGRFQLLGPNPGHSSPPVPTIRLHFWVVG